MATFRILSLDGGGIRGIIPTILLQRLNADKSLSGWLDSVDLIAGTSTGGLIALGLANKVNLQDLRNIYEAKGPKVFDDSWLDNLVNLGQVAGAQYDNKNLEKELKSLFGQTTLAQLKKKVLITSFDLDNESENPDERSWKPKVFHNFPGDDSDGAEFAYKVGLYTSAAPTFFPSVDGYVDGGVYANNPSMCALAQSQDRRIGNRPGLDEVVLFSLGTGTSLIYIKDKRVDWGYAQWAKPLVSLMMDGVSGIAHFQCRTILGKQYHRIAPVFPAGVSLPLDAVDRVPDMVRFANSIDLTATRAWIKKYWLGK